MKHAGRSDTGKRHLATPVFKKRKRFCKMLNYELYFITWSSKKRSGWVIIPVTSFPSLRDILDYGARGNGTEWTFELKQGISRGFQDVFKDQLEECWLNRRPKERMKCSSHGTTCRLSFCFFSLPCYQLHRKGWLPLVVKRWLQCTCHEQGEGSF